MASTEPFTFVETTKDLAKDGYGDYVDILSAKSADVDLQFSSRLRKEYPEMIVTTVPGSNIDLILFANLGYASYELEVNDDNVSRWRGYIGPGPRGGEGYLGEIINYARYKYKFGDEFFIVFYVKWGYSALQYVLKEPRDGETINSISSYTDKLIKAAGDVLYKQQPGIFVFDNYWFKDHKLYEEVQKASWDKVILDADMKKDLTEVTEKFFDSKDVYDDLGVPWKRGIMFHGPPGNGKTISIKALMHTISQRSPAIPALYVKSAAATYYIRSMFEFARVMAPCLLILEDIETIVTPSSRSYFFNEVDGLENNDGILMVASTNYLDRLDPGLTKRPSRFDRKYLFPLPSDEERVLYAEYWHEKLKKNKNIIFPKKLCAAIAAITNGFSFAYMQEAFVATLLSLARRRTDLVESASTLTLGDGGDDDLEQYEFWRVFKEQVKILRRDMDSTQGGHLGQHLGGHQTMFEPTSLSSSQVVDPMKDSLPSMPGAYREQCHGFPGESIPVITKRDEPARVAQAQQFLSLDEMYKFNYRNRAADEFRPLNDAASLYYAKRS